MLLFNIPLFASIQPLHVNIPNTFVYTKTLSHSNALSLNSFTNAVIYNNLDKSKGANRQLSGSEIDILQHAKQNKTQEEQYRLTAAACALTNCADGVSDKDPNYQQLLQLQNDGKEYKDEQSILLQSSSISFLEENKDITDDSLIGTPPFFYMPQDYVTDKITSNELDTRALGGVQAITGIADIGASLIACSTTAGVGCTIGGSALWTIGWDNYYTGTQTLISGEQQSTLGATVISQLTGLTPETSELIYAGMNIGAGVGVGIKTVGNVGGVGTDATKINAFDLTLTKTVENHLGDMSKSGIPVRPYGDSRQLIQEIINSKTPISDPGGVSGALRWDVQGTMNGKQGMYELVVDPNTNTVLHFLFKSTK
ncbi:MAG: hypothetical protein LBI78_05720 [Campylobacteraceae bacterium]|nr:hypothetical protein [Campylobacteraceae bacterium]